MAPWSALVLPAVLPQHVLDRLFGFLLDGGVEGRLHGQDAVGAELAFRGQALDLLERPIEIVVRSDVAACG